MVFKERNLLVALLVALCATVNHAASISTTTEASTTVATTTTTTPTESDEAQKETNFNRTDGRTENARSLDLDINKYTSVDFHNKVYDLQTSPENEKFISQEVSKVHTTYRTSYTSQNVNDYENYELTTPKTILFDEKHKQVQNDIKMKLEIDQNVQIEKPSSDEVVKHNETNLDLVRYTNILGDDDVRNKTSIHRNYETEKGLKINYESVYNESDAVQKVHNAKSPLLNNKIENDKAINISKRGFTKQPQTGNSTTDRPATDLPQDRSNLIPSLETTTNNQEQAQQENNIYPVLVPIPLTTTASVSTEPSSHTKLYEMTENDFATTTESAFEVNGSEEKFYEMTETATTTAAPEVETTTENLNKTIATTSTTHEDELITTTTEQQEVFTTENALQTTISEEKEDLEKTTTFAPTTTTTGTTEAENLTTTLQAVDDDATTTTTTTTAATTTELDLVTSTVESTSKSVTINNQTTTEPELTASTLFSLITTTLQQITDTTIGYESTSVAAPSNEIKKANTSSDHELDDFTEEVTDDDYMDVRKIKPVPQNIPKKAEVEAVNETHSVTEAPERVTTTTTVETTTNEDAASDVPEEASRTPEPEGASSGTIIAIVLSTVGAICLILLAVLLFVMRRRQKRFNYGQRCTPVSLDAYSMDNVSVYNSVRRKNAIRGSKRSYGNPAFDDDTSISHPMNFQAIVRFANQADEIRAEFEEIPLVSAKMHELPDGCASKNRYANVIPLPESRVFLAQLEDDPTSDYINANYVTGPKGARGYYIACQAPLHNTVNDFWRMIWEQQSKVILMLTHLFENGVEKCVDYLPPSEVVDCHRLFGDFQVTLKKREVKDKYIISSLQLKNMVSNSWREVTHLWYSGWPEKGVPEEENSIIAFLIEARSYIRLVQNAEPKENGITSTTSNGRSSQPDSSPVVVHCSPGTGRTGSVIACDIAIREFELRRIVDIPRIVYRIRRDRASSVQTKDQYHFIYKVINLYATKLTGGALDSI